jgi:Arc/MetJ-type ribon-helix-helix transcriptional regulator
MSVISIRIDEQTRRKMKLLSHLNWSEVIRQAITQKIKEEENRKRRLDPKMLKEAAEITDRIRKPSPSWSSTEEIRKWRDLRKS